MTRVVNIAQSGGNNVTMRNRIINGAMVIDQRNAGASVTPASGGYTLDRWYADMSAASKYSVVRSSVAPAGFINSMLITSTSAYSVGSGDYFYVFQAIEGLNMADLGWGTSSAQTVTLSFWVRSSLTGTFGGALKNQSSTRSYAFTYTINSANTWEQKSITVAGDTTGTWLTTNGVGVYVCLGIGVGATFSGAAGSWAGANYLSATGATSVVGTSGATFYITGVQLEAGTTATPFEQRLYGTELALCQRYAYQATGGGSGNLYIGFGVGQVSSSTVAYAYIPLPATLRSAPTATYSGTLTINSGGTDYPITSLSTLYGYGSGVWLTTVASGGGMTAGRGVIFYTGLASSNWILFSAEL